MIDNYHCCTAVVLLCSIAAVIALPNQFLTPCGRSKGFNCIETL